LVARRALPSLAVLLNPDDPISVLQEARSRCSGVTAGDRWRGDRV